MNKLHKTVSSTLKGAEGITEWLKENTLAGCVILFLWPVWLILISLPLFCCCHPSLPPFCTSLSLTSALLAFALLLSFFLISPSTSLLCSHLSSSCHTTFLSPPPSPLFLSSLASHLHYPPPCNCAHSLKIFPLHSNAPPHYCSLCCLWCRRQCWDVKLHQRRLHIASAHFPVVSWSWKWFSIALSLLTPASSLSFFSFLLISDTLTSRSFFFLSCLSACLFVPPHQEKNSVHKLPGHMCLWNHFSPFSVILHIKSTSRPAAWAAYEHREED